MENIPWRRAGQPTPVFLPEEFHGQRSLVGYKSWAHKESGTTEATQHTRTHVRERRAKPTAVPPWALQDCKGMPLRQNLGKPGFHFKLLRKLRTYIFSDETTMEDFKKQLNKQDTHASHPCKKDPINSKHGAFLFYSCDTEGAWRIRVEALKSSGWLNYLRPQQKISLPFFRSQWRINSLINLKTYQRKETNKYWKALHAKYHSPRPPPPPQARNQWDP